MLAGIAAAVISALIIREFTKPPPPPPPPPTYSLSGIWQYTLTSNVNHIALHGSLQLVMDGARIGGDFIEDFPDGSSKGVHGSYHGVTLELARDTGKNATQNYYLTRQDDNRLTGTFRNVGPPETRDDGSFDLVR